MDMPVPDRAFGHSEAQLRALFGSEFPCFDNYMNMKATARDADGLVFFTADVTRYLEIRGLERP
ncbi:hypothetical protein ACNPM8_13145 [Glutamicibacter sp. AGC46]